MVATRPEAPPLVQALSKLYISWSDKVMKPNPSHGDSISATQSRVLNLFVNNIGKLVEKICKIAERDQKRLLPEDSGAITASLKKLSIATPGLHRMYDGPGEGRHDNDFKSIKDISIEPTHEELLSEKVCFQVGYRIRR